METPTSLENDLDISALEINRGVGSVAQQLIAHTLLW